MDAPTLPATPAQLRSPPSPHAGRLTIRRGSTLVDSDGAGESFRVLSLPRLTSRRVSGTAVVPFSGPSTQLQRPEALTSATLSTFSRYTSAFTSRLGRADQRVVQFGLSLPMIFILSVTVAASYTLDFLSDTGVEWIPRDLTGDIEWRSTTRTHLAHDPLVLLGDLLSADTIGVDTSVSVNFLAKYGVASEANVSSTAKTLNATWFDPAYIMGHGFTIAGQMAGAFEGVGIWPCAAAIAKHPIITAVCPDPATDWFAMQIFNNPVATSSEKASTYLSLSYTPLSLMTARIWPAMVPNIVDNGIVMRGYKEGNYTARVVHVLTRDNGQLALAEVRACNRETQSNALECDRLESDDIYMRNYYTRDYDPPEKLDKLKVYGPAYAMGNYVAADKNFVQLPAVAIVETNAGYSTATRFGTTLPFRLVLLSGVLAAEYSVPQVATYTDAVGTSFAAAAYQMIIVCLVVYNAITHCRTSPDVVAREGRIFGFYNHITMGIVARRLGSYKVVAAQLCVCHSLNVRRYFAAVYFNTQKTKDTIAFTSEGILLMVASTMLFDQLFFFERYSSVRETLTIIGSCGLYVLHLHFNMHYFLTVTQVQVTELAVCAGANQCYVFHGLEYYYIGLFVCLLVPVAVVNSVVNRCLVTTRASYPRNGVDRQKLTSFERFCLGLDARTEFGDFDRISSGTPISIVHAAGFTYVGPYLVRVKDYYLVVLGRVLPESLVKSSGLTLSLFRIKDGHIVAGRHILLAAAYKYFREDRTDNYEPLP